MNNENERSAWRVCRIGFIKHKSAQRRIEDRSDQYPDLAECKHGFVRRRIYSVILGRVALSSRGAVRFFAFSDPTSQCEIS